MLDLFVRTPPVIHTDMAKMPARQFVIWLLLQYGVEQLLAILLISMDFLLQRLLHQCVDRFFIDRDLVADQRSATPDMSA